MENGYEIMVQVVAEVQDTIENHEDALNTYINQLNDYKNRDRRQNIHINGLPEAIQTAKLISTVQKESIMKMAHSKPEIVFDDTNLFLYLPPDPFPTSFSPTLARSPACSGG